MVTIFVHIPRTGGTVFTHTVLANYDRQFLLNFDLVGPEFPGGNFAPAVRRRQNMSVIDFSKDTPEFSFILSGFNGNQKWIAGHVTYNVHECLKGKEYQYVSIVRNPVDRVWSNYTQMMKPLTQPVNRLMPLFAKYGGNLDEMLDSQEFPEFSNDQTRMLLGKPVSNTFSAVEAAIAHVRKHYFYVGTTENLRKTIQEIGGLYSWTKLEIPQLRSKLKQPTPELAEKIRKYNMVDYVLWEYIKELGPTRSNFLQDTKML